MLALLVFKFRQLVHKPKLLPSKQYPNDIWLVSFPKSGNTWMRFLIANLMLKHCRKKIKVDFTNINNFVPSIYVNQNIPVNKEISPFPRIIKTHGQYSKVYKNSIYILRDPRDAMVSYYHHQVKGRGSSYSSFSDFIRDPKHGIVAWCQNVKSWSNHATKIITYKNLKTDPQSEILNAISLFNVKPSNQTISYAIKQSAFDKMKQADRQYPQWKKAYKLDPSFSFVRKGKVGQYKQYFSASDIKYLKKIIRLYGLSRFVKKHGYKL